eukprot:4290216-Prymnesium_polylepis.2
MANVGAIASEKRAPRSKQHRPAPPLQLRPNRARTAPEPSPNNRSDHTERTIRATRAPHAPQRSDAGGAQLARAPPSLGGRAR